jgi:branched-chain amino acid transport system substrate-binding protein
MQSGSNLITGRGHRYTFRTCLNYNNLSQGAINTLTEIIVPKVKANLKDMKVALMLEDSAYGSGMRPALEELLAKVGIKPVAIEMYSTKSSDLSPMVLRFKSLNPDVVIACSYANDAILFVRQARQYNLNLKGLIGTGGGYGMPDLVRAVGSDADGLFNTGATLSINPNAVDPASRKVLAEFNTRFEKKANHAPSTHAALGFQGTWFLLTQVLSKTGGSTDPDKVREAAFTVDLPVGKGINGFGLKFAPNGHNQRAFSVVQQWQGGKLHAVYPREVATHKPTLVPLPAWIDRPRK